jgi:hypothetical protein
MVARSFPSNVVVFTAWVFATTAAAAQLPPAQPPQVPSDPAPRAQPSLSTLSLGLSITWEECRTRVSRALSAEGFSSLNDFGNGWEGWARGGAVSAGCAIGAGETVVTIVTTASAEGFDAAAESKRLLDRVGGDLPPPPPPPATSIGRGWGVDARSVTGRNRQRFSVTCPADGSIGPVWGSDLYTDDSSVCSAGVHAGTITARAGGTVTIEVRPGVGSYDGSTRNGVESDDYGPWEGSFVVIRTPPPLSAPMGGTGWTATAMAFRGRIGERFGFTCPAGGPAGGVWGTDVYADDSSVCSAAVHAGLISISLGGSVVIELRAGEESYRGAARNGLTSEAWDRSGGSFVFVR